MLLKVIRRLENEIFREEEDENGKNFEISILNVFNTNHRHTGEENNTKICTRIESLEFILRSSLKCCWIRFGCRFLEEATDTRISSSQTHGSAPWWWSWILRWVLMLETVLLSYQLQLHLDSDKICRREKKNSIRKMEEWIKHKMIWEHKTARNIFLFPFFFISISHFLSPPLLSNLFFLYPKVFTFPVINEMGAGFCGAQLSSFGELLNSQATLS